MHCLHPSPGRPTLNPRRAFCQHLITLQTTRYPDPDLIISDPCIVYIQCQAGGWSRSESELARSLGLNCDHPNAISSLTVCSTSLKSGPHGLGRPNFRIYICLTMPLAIYRLIALYEGLL
eukprot:scaffold161237_cov22-Tisochrysis_lutea.AAC.3